MNHRHAVLACALAAQASIARAPTPSWVEIPIVFDRAGLPMVDMPIDGKDARFYLDIGARGLHLPPDLVDRIRGLERIDSAVRSIDLAGKTRTDRAFAIRELRMGGLVFHDLRGQTLSDWGIGKAEFQLPVVGLDVLDQKAFVIDFPGRRLLLSDSAIPFDSLHPSARALPSAQAREGLLVDVLVGGRKLPFVLDCASSISIVKASAGLDDSLFRPCALDLPGAKCEMAGARLGSGGEPIELRLVRMPIPDRFVPTGIVGRDFFGRCALYKHGATTEASCTASAPSPGDPPRKSSGARSGD